MGSTEAARRCSAAAPPRITLRACACAWCVGSTASRAATVAPLAAWATPLATALLPASGAWPLTSCCGTVAPCMRAPRNVAAAAAGGGPDTVPRLLLPPFELIASCPNHSRPSALARRPRPCPPAPPGSEVTHAAPPRASTGSPPRGKRGSMARVLHTGGRVSEEPPAHRIGAAPLGAQGRKGVPRNATQIRTSVPRQPDPPPCAVWPDQRWTHGGDGPACRQARQHAPRCWRESNPLSSRASPHRSPSPCKQCWHPFFVR